MCDGHFYLSEAELGTQLVCPKCGLPVTIGQPKKAKPPQDHGVGLLGKILPFVLGIAIGFLLALALR